MLKTAANPEGLPIELFDKLRSGIMKDRSQFYKDLAIPFYGANRPGAKVSQGTHRAQTEASFVVCVAICAGADRRW